MRFHARPAADGFADQQWGRLPFGAPRAGHPPTAVNPARRVSNSVSPDATTTPPGIRFFSAYRKQGNARPAKYVNSAIESY